MIDIEEGRRLQKLASMKRDRSNIQEHNAAVTWEGRWHHWIIQNGPELLDELERSKEEARQVRTEWVPPEGRHTG